MSKAKSVAICLAGSADEGLVDNALLLCRNDMSKCYHKNMNGEVFESWFGDKLVLNLP